MIAESNQEYSALVLGFLTDREESNWHPEMEEELCIGYGLCVTNAAGWFTALIMKPKSPATHPKCLPRAVRNRAQVIP